MSRPSVGNSCDIDSRAPTSIDPTSHEFIIPKKELSMASDMQQWQKSEAYGDIMGFIQAMNDGVKDKAISEAVHMSPLTDKLVAMLSNIDDWIDEIPPIEQPQRFGNKAFRQFFERLQANAFDLLKAALGERYENAATEISAYLIESVGNSTRIDYGTGHELAFIAFLCCLYKIGAFTEADAPAVVLRIFVRYLALVRRLQTVYRMEPAGSHGVWSLDDFQFVPFIWGSAQLYNNSAIPPSSFVDKNVANRHANDYMFMACIKYIHEVKTGMFAEHSNTLWSISDVPMWSKVNSGLLKMYRAEILAKFPVIQHFLFGSLLTLNPAT